MSNTLSHSLALSLALLGPASPVVANAISNTNGQINTVLAQGNLPQPREAFVEVIGRDDSRHSHYIAPSVAQSSSLGDSNPIPLSLLIGGGAGLVGLGIGAGFALGTKQAKREAEVDAELGEFYL